MSELKPCPHCKIIPERSGVDTPVAVHTCKSDIPSGDVVIERVSRWQMRPIEDALLFRAEAAEQKLRELQERTRWRKYPDEKPQDSGTYRIRFKLQNTEPMEVESYFAAVGQTFRVWDSCITHWQPLPEPPEAENE